MVNIMTEMTDRQLTQLEQLKAEKAHMEKAFSELVNRLEAEFSGLKVTTKDGQEGVAKIQGTIAT
jgi:hypothetical protein